MRRIVLTLSSTLAAVVLLFGYKTSTGATASSAPFTTSTPDTRGTPAGAGADPVPTAAPTTAAAATPGTAAASPSATATGQAAAAAGTFTGDVVGTRWGDVQVAITVADGKITAAEAVEVPSGNHRDQEINAYAVPVLNGEVVSAQSAQIDTVSGATVTSDGYLSSLQSAIDQAGL